MMIKRTLCLALLAAMTLTGCDETGDELSAQDHEALTDEALGTPEELIDPNAPMPEDEGPVDTADVRDGASEDFAAERSPAGANLSAVPWTISPASSCLNNSDCGSGERCDPVWLGEFTGFRCVGECSSDADCNQGEDCGADGFCEVLIKGDWDFCQFGGCQRGHGDCDSSSDCEGSLSCMNNIGSTWGYSSTVDVCDYAPGSGNFCSSAHPCGVGQGDCDSNAQCGFGLLCKDNRGGEFGFASWVDVCLLPWQ